MRSAGRLVCCITRGKYCEEERPLMSINTSENHEKGLMRTRSLTQKSSNPCRRYNMAEGNTAAEAKKTFCKWDKDLRGDRAGVKSKMGGGSKQI